MISSSKDASLVEVVLLRLDDMVHRRLVGSRRNDEQSLVTETMGRPTKMDGRSTGRRVTHEKRAGRDATGSRRQSVIQSVRLAYPTFDSPKLESTN